MVTEIKRKDLVVFGTIWALIFIIIGLYPLINNNGINILFILIAGVFIVLSIVKPTIMSRFYLIWVKFGEYIGNIISKIIMFVLYFGVFTPVALILKVIGKDLLSKRIDKNAQTYWEEREVQPQSMKNQF